MLDAGTGPPWDRILGSTPAAGRLAAAYTKDGSAPQDYPTAKLYPPPFTVSQTRRCGLLVRTSRPTWKTTNSQQVRIDAVRADGLNHLARAGLASRGGTKVYGSTATAIGPGQPLRAPSGLTSVAFFLDGPEPGTDPPARTPLTWNTVQLRAMDAQDLLSLNNTLTKNKEPPPRLLSSNYSEFRCFPSGRF